MSDSQGCAASREGREAVSIPLRTPVLVVGLVVAALLASGRLTSQTRAEYQSRIDSLEADWELKRSEFRALADALVPYDVDTIKAGPFTVLADAVIGDLMEQAVPLAWEALRETLGSDSMLAASRLLYFPGAGSRRIRQSTDVAVGPWVGDSWDVEDVVNRIVLTAGTELGTLLDDGPRLWLGTNVLAPAAAAGRGWSGSNLRWAYVELATSGSAVGRGCFAGDLTACSVALELVPVSDPIAVWYDDDDRRRFVARTGMPREWGAAEEWTQCVEQRDDAACESLIRARLEGSTLHPVSPMVHETLFATALELGGAGAFGRMIRTDGGSIAGWIGAVADASADSVVARWHSDVLAARPAVTTLTAATAWGAAVWIVALAALATRSTRWRS